jgi:Trk K+ transport system NAD-binding subunit
MTKQEILLAGLIAPRGIVCAAMAGVIGPLLVSAGYADGEKILPLCFAIVVISVVLHSLMIKPLARKLKLVAAQENGIVVIGAFDWSSQFCEALMAQKVPVLLADKNWEALAAPRLNGVPVHYGEILSEETEFHQNMAQYNTALVATRNSAYNSLAFKALSHDYGAERVVNVLYRDEDKSERHKIGVHELGNLFVSKEFSHAQISKYYSEGWRFRVVRVGEDENEELIYPKENDTCIHVGTLSEHGFLKLYFDTDVDRPSLKKDEFLILFEQSS